MWFFLSLATAFLNATEAAYLKKFFSDLSAWEMTAFPFLYAAPMFAVGLLLVDIPPLAEGFWPWTLVLLPLNMAGLICHFRAIHTSQLSLTMPFLAFTPAFVLLTGFLFLGELPTLMGAFGVGLIVFGGYFLARTQDSSSPLAPFRALAGDQGAVCMLAASVIYAFCSVIGKMLILKSSPLFFGFFFFGMFSIVVVLGFTATGKIRLPILFSRPGRGCIVAGLIVAHITFHHLAIAIVDAAYMMSIKRLNGIFSVLYGWLFFKESDIGKRLVGAAIMALGAAFIAFGG